jgi:hypothetical protein
MSPWDAFDIIAARLSRPTSRIGLMIVLSCARRQPLEARQPGESVSNRVQGVGQRHLA